MKIACTIAGSDSCGGAGIQADIKSMSANGVYAMSVITAITAQNSQGVFAVQDVDPGIISKQIEVLFEDINIDAVKIGMVSQIASIEAIATSLAKYNYKNIILDPVMVSKSGYKLLLPEAENSLIKRLLPMALVVTPNIPEAAVFVKMPIKSIADMRQAALKIHALGPKYVLLKGGHLSDEIAVDILYDGNEFFVYKSKRINTKNTHGTGCTLSSAIAANIAKGMAVPKAVEKAKQYITGAIVNSFSIGKGVGPTHHFYEFYSSNSK
ncbi:bifunctional hydroxymethylpyrimidine kinase/phosphomethylpyrimidine kinase [Clostridium sp. 'deep sea']|uniref:bifunctional hydroxymethylpyrimidine kinase/phosphomethylpyrimidine kinase n=1 Tax=Clostridium sp. 'deep sea' TaxID=2779445 RepID=UPI00189647A1|nr:bifunctional hydroxymethylpyrimidine kinase/phosphomethylpyrimidine kinase [Clostridium sp. 'deep sea']QOR36721.1 bifunctional hydroxymethylpyrimidine kinase/phosphomethylpyrimidine kinase [Clostridium sp. 'deep sea']